MSDLYQQLGIVHWVTKQQPEVAISTNLVIIAETGTPNDAADLLLTAMLKAIDLTRDDVCVTDASQINHTQARLILAMGETAAQTLLNTDAPLESLRGKLHQYGEQQTPLIVTYHPLDLIRNPADKKQAFVDLKFAKSQL